MCDVEGCGDELERVAGRGCTLTLQALAPPCLQSVAVGMGGGLLQRLNRDTLNFATKLSHIVYADGTAADVVKAPKDDPLKGSLPGELAVKRVRVGPAC